MKYDLRHALDVLKAHPNQLYASDEPVDCHAEIAGVYRHIGAGGTVMRPTRTGPAMLFHQVKEHPDARVLIGLLASRERVGLLLDTPPDRLGFLLKDALARPVEPVLIGNGDALCQQVVHRADEAGFDIRKILPAPTNTAEDAGPYITMGMVYGEDPETGDRDITIHRMCLQDKDLLSIYFVPGARHIDAFRKKAEAAGKPFPVSVSIGVDPAIEIASCFEPPTTPLGFNELCIAGAIRNQPVETARCLTVDAQCIANAEYVIEGYVLPNVRVAEDQNTNTGKAMPEFPGYTGNANPSLPVIKVTAVTHRVNPILQCCIGPSEEHVNMAGIPTEASIMLLVDKAMPGRLLNVYAASAGGGKYMAVLQFKKSQPSDEGRQRQAALLAFSAFSELKHLFLVDDDVDPFDLSDVIWAMNTRFQGDMDIICIPGVRCHPLDPSQRPSYSRTITDQGISCKTIFDCTAPYHLKEQFRRSSFMDVDYKRFAPELFR